MPLYVDVLLLFGRKATERVDSAGCTSHPLHCLSFAQSSVPLPQNGLGENP